MSGSFRAALAISAVRQLRWRLSSAELPECHLADEFRRGITAVAGS
jgi:hypothetical protein